MINYFYFIRWASKSASATRGSLGTRRLHSKTMEPTRCRAAVAGLLTHQAPLYMSAVADELLVTTNSVLDPTIYEVCKTERATKPCGTPVTRLTRPQHYSRNST